MRHFGHYRQIFAVLPSLVMTATLLFPSAARSQDEKSSAREEERSSLAVDNLKKALQSSEEGRKNLQEAADNLKDVRDLRLALLLTDWQDEGILPTSVPGIVVPERVGHRAIHQQVEDRLARIIQNGLSSKDADQQVASATLLAEIGAQIPGTRSRRGFASTFTPDLARLLKSENPAVAEAAARALGRIFPDPRVAGDALGGVFQDRRDSEKRAAAEALVSLIQEVDQLAKSRAILGIKPTFEDRLRVAESDTKAANRGLHDPDAEVRRLCAEAIGRAAATLEDMIPDVKESSDVPAAALADVAKELGQQGESLGSLLRDSHPQVRFNAAQALMEIARAESRFARRGTGAPSQPQLKEKGAGVLGTGPQDALRNGLRAALPALGKSLSDPDVRVRLAAVTALDLMGQDAAPAARALNHALKDPDIFVRWAAARALGNIDPADGKIAVPNLGRLLFDPDLDPRLAAAATLEHYGRDATAAVPDLIRATSVGDAEIRIAVIHAIEAIGADDARSAVPALAQALSDPDDRVRQAAAEALGGFGSVAKSAEPALRRALDDKEPTVRRAASSALLNLKKE
jgi:HEAT repeat protein